MTRILIFLILSLQTINWILSADTYVPLILNENDEGELSFPNYVGKTNGGTIEYVEPGQSGATSTYVFCRPDSDTDYLEGTPLEDAERDDCPYRFKFFRESIKDDNGADGYTKHRAYYKLRINGAIFEHTLYEYWVNEKQLQTKFTYYLLDNPSLLRMKSLSKQEQNMKFTMESVEVNNPEQDEGIAENYNDPEFDYVRKEIAIPDFIPFAQWKVTLFQWQNIAPMNKNLIEPWNKLIEKLVSLLSTTEPIKVYSGIHGTVRHGGVAKYLKNGITEIPFFWWITFYDKEETCGITVIMHNYAYDRGEDRHPRLCEVSEDEDDFCERVGLNVAIPQEYDQALIYCCPANIFPKKIEDENIPLLDFEYFTAKYRNF